MDSIDKFLGRAEGYEKYRPAYPKELIDYFYREVGVSPKSVIADMGSGTGLMSRLLLERGSRVLCVEPNADMRSVARDKLKGYSSCQWIDAPAEYTGLPERSVDFITAAQAFHWFDQERFAAECKRILRPGGKVALVWNHREKEDALTREIWVVCKQICPDFPGFSGGKETGDHRAFFRDGMYEQRSFSNNLEMDLEQFLGRCLSSSYAPQKGKSGYREFVEALTGVFKQYQQHGKIKLLNAAYCYVGEV